MRGDLFDVRGRFWQGRFVRRLRFQHNLIWKRSVRLLLNRHHRSEQRHLCLYVGELLLHLGLCLRELRFLLLFPSDTTQALLFGSMSREHHCTHDMFDWWHCPWRNDSGRRRRVLLYWWPGESLAEQWKENRSTRLTVVEVEAAGVAARLPHTRVRSDAW